MIIKFNYAQKSFTVCFHSLLSIPNKPDHKNPLAYLMDQSDFSILNHRQAGHLRFRQIKETLDFPVYNDKNNFFCILKV